MTDTPIDPQDVVIKPPPATVYGKVSFSMTVVMNVSGVVKKLAAEGASDQTILEAIRQESPEMANVVEANATTAPQGWSFYQWVILIVMLYGAAVHTFDVARPQSSPPSVEEIEQIVEDVLSKQWPALPSPGEEKPKR